MGHDTSKVLMGSTASNIKEVTNFQSVSGLPIEAGLAVILEASGKVSLDTSEGSLVGVSLGKDLSDTNKTAVCRKGARVPLKLKSAFNPVIGAAVQIETDTGLGVTSGNAVNAVYASGRIGGSGATGGVVEGALTDTGTVGVALIDFIGGL